MVAIEKELIEKIGKLSSELIDIRIDNENNERIKEVLKSKVYKNTTSTCGENIENHMLVIMEGERKVELSGIWDHYSGYQHEP